jgi:hypothetical protein
MLCIPSSLHSPQINTATTPGSFRLPSSRRAAKSKLSELVEKADAGQEVIITWRGRPVVELLRENFERFPLI